MCKIDETKKLLNGIEIQDNNKFKVVSFFLIKLIFIIIFRFQNNF